MRSVISEHGHGAGVGVYIRNMLQINGPFRTCEFLFRLQMQDWKMFAVNQIRAERNYIVKIQKMKSVEKKKKSFSARTCPTQQNACIFQ